MVIGTQAKGTMVGEFPGLAQLDEDDNLRHTTDFRAVYCSLLEQWLDVDAAGIIPNAVVVPATGAGGVICGSHSSRCWWRRSSPPPRTRASRGRTPASRSPR